MTLPKDINAYLTRRFYNPRLPGSFTSASKLHSVIKREGRYNISLARINEWAKGEDILSLHKDSKNPQKYRRVYAPGANHIWDADLLQLNGERFKKANSNYSFILVTVDIFSRVCRAEATKSKSSKDMIVCFKKIFQRTQERPLYIRMDRGVEFTAHQVRDYLKDQGIKVVYSNSESKAHFSEILVKNIKKRLFQFFQHTNSYSYINNLQDIIHSYNSTVHSSLGVSPLEVTAQNEQDIFNYQYRRQSAKSLKKLMEYAVKTHRNRKRNLYKYNIGQHVRLAYYRKKNFTRSYDEQFSGEVFTVRARKITDGIAQYYLRDYNGEDLKGPVYASEITPVTIDADGYFKLEKVLRTRVRNGKKEYLVKFQSWPEKFSKWVPSENIKTLTQKKIGSARVKSHKPRVSGDKIVPPLTSQRSTRVNKNSGDFGNGQK